MIRTVLIAMLLLSEPALARRGAREPDRSTGQMVGGILFTSIGPSIFATMWFAGANTSCYKSGTHCRETALEQRRVGMVGTAASIAVGCYMISEAREDRREWQRWKDEQEQEEPKEAESKPQATLGLTILPRFAAATLTVPLE